MDDRNLEPFRYKIYLAEDFRLVAEGDWDYSLPYTYSEVIEKIVGLNLLTPDGNDIRIEGILNKDHPEPEKIYFMVFIKHETDITWQYKMKGCLVRRSKWGIQSI